MEGVTVTLPIQSNYHKGFYFRAKAESNNQDKTRSISKIAILTKGTLLLPSIIPSAIKF